MKVILFSRDNIVPIETWLAKGGGGGNKGRNGCIDRTITDNCWGKAKEAWNIVFITLFQSVLSTLLPCSACFAITFPSTNLHAPTGLSFA